MPCLQFTCTGKEAAQQEAVASKAEVDAAAALSKHSLFIHSFILYTCTGKEAAQQEAVASKAEVDAAAASSEEAASLQSQLTQVRSLGGFIRNKY